MRVMNEMSLDMPKLSARFYNIKSSMSTLLNGIARPID
jgi:hypothetical protein